LYLKLLPLHTGQQKLQILFGVKIETRLALAAEIKLKFTKT
jgi:hypothetical protein